MTTEITTVEELSFIARDADGIRIDWHPTRITHSPSAAVQYGLACVTREVAQLACVDEHDAYTAILHALTSRAWNDQCAEELGFADGLARVAVIGLRAMSAQDHLPFSVEFEPSLALRCSLQTRVELLEAQLQAMQVKPWRKPEQAGTQ